MMIYSIIGTIIGGILGYLIGKNFSKFGVGCMILCNSRISTIYFALIGLLIGSGY